jgi:hypothetical protein
MHSNTYIYIYRQGTNKNNITSKIETNHTLVFYTSLLMDKTIFLGAINLIDGT